MKLQPEPVQPRKCATCPFRPGSPHADLAEMLTEYALTKGSRICHSTGPDNAINKNTGKAAHICRGTRDVQLAYMHAAGVIDAPTDEAWTRAVEEVNAGRRKKVKETACR